MNYNTNEPKQHREWKLITPEFAKIILDQYNNYNREAISEKDVSRYMMSIKMGAWDIDSIDNYIAFYENGQLANGQHRLWAIVKSGVAVPMWVYYGIKLGTVFDRGHNRTVEDQAQIDGLNMKRSHSACIRFILNMYGFPYPDDSMIREYYLKYAEKLDRAMKICDKKSVNGKYILKNSTSYAAIFFALLNGISEEVLEEFVTIACTLRYDSEKKSSALLVFQYNTDEKSKRRVVNNGWTDKRRYFSIICQAIRDFNQGKPRKRMYQPIECDFMLNFPKYVDKDFIQKYKR